MVNWDAVGAIGELVAAVGVIVTLGFLAMQVRQNTKMMRANIKEQRTHSSQQVIFHVAEHAAVLAKKTEGKELTTEERIKLKMLAVAQHRGYEAYAHQFRSGLYADDEWTGILATIRGQLEFEHFRVAFEEDPKIYSKHYQTLVEDLLRKRHMT